MTIDSFEFNIKNNPNVKIVTQKGTLLAESRYQKPRQGHALILVRQDPNNPFAKVIEDISRPSKFNYWTKELPKDQYEIYSVRKTYLKK